MNYLKYYKIFESLEKEEFSSIQSFLFTQTKEDIEDLFINLIDHDFMIDIKSNITYENFNEVELKRGFDNRYYYGPARVLENLVNGEVFGCYSIKIALPDKHNLTSGDLSRWSLLFSELKRIASKCKYFDCSIIDKTSWNNQPSSIQVKILCEPIKNKLKLKEFLNKILDAEIIGNKSKYYGSAIQSIKSALTPAMKLVKYPTRIDDKIYFIFKPVSKQILNLNLKRMQTNAVYNIKSIKLANADELLEGPLKSEVPDFLKPVIIIEAELDLKRIDTESLQSTNIEFLKNLIKKVT